MANLIREKIELLAPAGDLEKLKIAALYGADAVYFGGQNFSLRAASSNFDIKELNEGLDFLHSLGKKGYLTLNIYAHNYDLTGLRNYLYEIKDIPFDGIIVSDPGVIMLCRKILPDVELHLSTQANTTNNLAAMFWTNQGIKRIVLARELSLTEIQEFRREIPSDVELEAFVHGAMCISYSGRCLLSNFLTGRDANHGACTHPCRWEYSLVEQNRPGEYFPIEEDDRGSYILNSRDLCMLDAIPDLLNAGITSLKIEGRMKSIYYVATVVSAYRREIDRFLSNPESYEFDLMNYQELCKASHREFTHGFYYNKPSSLDQNYISSDYIKEYSFIALGLSYDDVKKLCFLEQRNKFSVGDIVEVIGPDIDSYEDEILEIIDEDGNAVNDAPHPQQHLYVKLKFPFKPNYLMRKKLNK